MKLDTHILKLLLRHDCLIVPDFGGFVARNLSAKIDWGKSQIKAPRKELIFNRHLQKNDGLLLGSIAEENQIAYDEAATQLQAELEVWQKTMQSGNRVEIEKVGFLFKDASGNILFEQDRFFNLLLNSFGMGDVNFVLIEKEEVSKTNIELTKPIPVTAEIPRKKEAPIVALEKSVLPKKRVVAKDATPVTEKTVSLRKEKKTIKRHFPWRVAAAAVILPIGFFAYWIPMKTHVLETGKISVADFNLFRTIELPKYNSTKIEFEPKTYEVEKTFEEIRVSLPENVTVFNYKFNEDLYVPIRLHKKKSASKTATPFHLIGGCFADEQNAIDFVNTCLSKGYEAFVLDVKSGLHRVSIAQFTSTELARKSQKTIAQNGIETWLLRK